MKPTIHSVLAALLVGCAQVKTEQRDISSKTIYQLDAKGRTNAIVTEARTITTDAGGSTLISASQTLKGFKASQTDKTQGLSIQSTEQNSEIDRFIDMAEKVAPLLGAFYGVPTAPPRRAAPPGQKWILAPVDDPSQAQPETP